MFADDTTLSAIVQNIKCRKHVADGINDDLKEIESWAEKWKMKFNAKKTLLLDISRKSTADDSTIKFYTETLRPVESIKLVGIHIAKDLDWGAHVDKVAKRAGHSLSILRKAKKLIEPAGLVCLYKTKVGSNMEY